MAGVTYQYMALAADALGQHLLHRAFPQEEDAAAGPARNYSTRLSTLVSQLKFWNVQL
jgi:hypothetical protein